MNLKTDVDFREIIKSSAGRLRISMAYLARRAGINHQTLYNYLNKKSVMNSDILATVLSTLQKIKAEKAEKAKKKSPL